MASHGFGAGGFPPGGFGGGSGNAEFDTLARQYWQRWGEMLRAGAPSAQTQGAPFGFPGSGAGAGQSAATDAIPGWNEAVAWWSKLASGGMPQADVAIERFNAQARGWYAQIQQLAAQFSGRNADAGEVAKAWKELFGGQGGNPFADALRGMQGQGQQGFESWFEQVSPWLEKLRQDSRSWLGTPTLGFTREHEQRWKQLALAQQDYQQQSRAYQELMNEALQDAFRRFEEKLRACSEPGKQLDSARALFDLWIDAAEEAYAEIALSPRFRDAYGALVNAQMQLRSAVQREVEQAGDAMGMPTRTEVDAAHRKIARLERELRHLREQLDAGSVPAAPSRPGRAPMPASPVDSTAPASKAAAPKAAVKPPASKSVAVKRTAKKAPAKKAVSKAAAKPAAARPVVTKKAVAKKTAAGKVVTKKAIVKKAAAKKAAPSAARTAVAKSTTRAR